VFDLNDTYSVYGSWTSVFNPQNVRDEVGNLLDPVTGVNMEVGVKAEYFGGALNVSAAAFQLRQTNLPLALPVSQCKASLSCSEAAGEVESKGLEFEAAGALTANWQVMAGLTYNTAEYAQDSSAGKAGTKFATDRPSRLAKLSTSYRLPGTLSQWRVGGALRAQNEIYKTNNPIRQGGYTVVDVSAGWQATKSLDLRLNVYNLFDKTYYQAISTVASGNAFGAPRSFLVTAKYQF
jgi:outer membrane receptor for ferric coprogen and ferric-rhodotorulic acid